MYLTCVDESSDVSAECCRHHGWWCCGEVLLGAEQEVASVVICWGDEGMAVCVLSIDVDTLDGEELLAVAVEEDDRCRR